MLLTKLWDHSFTHAALSSVMNSALALFQLKQNALTKQLPVADFFIKKRDLHAGIIVNFYFFIIFVGLSEKFIIFILFLLYYVSDTF